jgi:hypothetical protein
MLVLPNPTQAWMGKQDNKSDLQLARMTDFALGDEAADVCISTTMWRQHKDVLLKVDRLRLGPTIHLFTEASQYLKAIEGAVARKHGGTSPDWVKLMVAAAQGTDPSACEAPVAALAQMRATPGKKPPAPPPCNADTTNPLASLRACVSTVEQRIANTKPVYFNEDKGGWAKRNMSIANIQYEVKQPASSSETTGTVTFDCQLQQSLFFQERREAEAATDFQGFRGMEKCRVIFTLEGGAWKVESRAYVSPINKEWTEVPANEVYWDAWPIVLLLLF